MVGPENSYFCRASLGRRQANILNVVNFSTVWAICMDPFATCYKSPLVDSMILKYHC